MNLYKYTKIDYIIDAINNGVYGSTLDNVNDPCQLPSRANGLCLRPYAKGKEWEEEKE